MALVKVQAIEIVPDFLAADESQHFVRSCIPETKTPAQFQIPFHGKEPEGAVV